jgi:hypothetical protein
MLFGFAVADILASASAKPATVHRTIHISAMLAISRSVALLHNRLV